MLTVRAVAYSGVGELIPLYALYALLFADHGLGTAEISSLLFIWSATSFVLEVPSGAWADTVSRRGLLVLAALLTAVGFATWTVWPGYAGFALGFVLWGIGGSLQSGTFQALLYDELAARAATDRYARVRGWCSTAAEGAALVGILVAAPLFVWGGYDLVGWASVGVVLLQAALAASLPAAPRAIAAADAVDLEDDVAPVAPAGAASTVAPASGLATYVTMLRTGTREALRNPRVRGGVLLASTLFGFTAFDEYFGLLADENGAATELVPILVGITVAGSLVGSVLAGRTAAMRSRTLSLALVVAGAALAVGALVGDAGALGFVGFAAIGLGYGIITNGVIVSEARLQDSIEGPARATVTSVMGLVAELVALSVYGVVAVAATWLPMSTSVALFAVPIIALALVVPRWLPSSDDESHGEHDQQTAD